MTKPDCYDYVRRYYGVPAFAGSRVRAGGKEGTLARKRGSLQYVWVRFDGDSFARGPYHPMDVEYLGVAEVAK